MKKLIGITGIILISCICISSLYTPVTSAKASPETESTAVVSAESQTYVLKSVNNRIVVYKKGEASPFLVTDSRTDHLPKSDILQLKNGIEVEGEKNLKRTLEDYCS